MKFKYYLESISGIGFFPMVSLMIFTVFFVLLLVYVFRADKKSLDEQSRMPL